MFEKATREHYRFASPQGLLTVEDLWELPLAAKSPVRASLDSIAKTLYKQLKETTEEVDNENAYRGSTISATTKASGPGSSDATFGCSRNRCLGKGIAAGTRGATVIENERLCTMNVRELIDGLQRLVRERPKVEGLPVFIGPAHEIEVIEHAPGKAVYLYRASAEFSALPLRPRCWKVPRGNE